MIYPLSSRASAIRLDPGRELDHRPEKILDCLVIGGGPAGLTAAIYLARYRRRFQVIDAGTSRAALIATSHNHAGFPEGVHGTVLLSRMTEQARKYGAHIVPGAVTGLDRRADDVFVAELNSQRIAARTILLATGVVDREPDLPNVPDAIQRGLVHHCGICEGYETLGKRVGVLGHANSGLHEALFLRTYTSDVTLLSLGCPLILSEEERRQVAEAGIAVVEEPVKHVVIEGERICAFKTRDGGHLSFDALYSALGSDARSDLVRGLGTRLDDKGCVITDEHQRSSTDGLFAAGDVVRSLDQISVAMGEAAIAATAIHNRLRGIPALTAFGDDTLSFAPQHLASRENTSAHSTLIHHGSR